MPFAVITDGDPDEDGDRTGVNRLRNLLSAITGSDAADEEDEDSVVALANARGLFIGEDTFETDLFNCGRANSMCQTLTELTTVNAAKNRADGWKAYPSSIDADRFIKDIKVIGKGRFAQRLATRITGNRCPHYIANAITYLTDLLS